MITNVPIKYNTTIVGTSFSVMLATLFKPPITTAPTAKTRKIPVAIFGIPNAVLTLETIELT